MDAIVKMMRSNNMPSALIHGSTTINLYLPAVLEWCDKTTADVKTQLRAYMDGVQSNAEYQKEASNRQKISAAKKTKKKS